MRRPTYAGPAFHQTDQLGHRLMNVTKGKPHAVFRRRLVVGYKVTDDWSVGRNTRIFWGRAVRVGTSDENGHETQLRLTGKNRGPDSMMHPAAPLSPGAGRRHGVAGGEIQRPDVASEEKAGVVRGGTRLVLALHAFRKMAGRSTNASRDKGIYPILRSTAHFTETCMRVLIIDDEESIGKTTSILLSGMGHEAVCATNSATALRELDKAPKSCS